MELTTIKIDEVEYVRKDSVQDLPICPEYAPYRIGKNYLIRTVTNFYIGTIIWVGDKEIVITNAAWVADTGRFHDAVTSGQMSEVEPFAPGPVIIGRGAIVDASEWKFEPITVQI